MYIYCQYWNTLWKDLLKFSTNSNIINVRRSIWIFLKKQIFYNWIIKSNRTCIYNVFFFIDFMCKMYLLKRFAYIMKYFGCIFVVYISVYPCGFCFPIPPIFANPDGFMRKVMRIKLTFVPSPSTCTR